MSIIINGSEIKGIVYNGVVCPGFYNGELITPKNEEPSPGLPEYRYFSKDKKNWTLTNLNIDDGEGGIIQGDGVCYYRYTAAYRVVENNFASAGWRLPTKGDYNNGPVRYGNYDAAAWNTKTVLDGFYRDSNTLSGYKTHTRSWADDPSSTTAKSYYHYQLSNGACGVSNEKIEYEHYYTVRMVSGG